MPHATAHRIVSANFVLAVSTVTGQPMASTVVATVFSLPFAAGMIASPDADLERGWLGHLGHRGPLHDLAWPVLALIPMALLHAPWIFMGPVLGWLSHLLADAVFGKAHGDRRPAGVPLFGRYVSLSGGRLASDGWTSRALLNGLGPVVLAGQLWHVLVS